LCCIYCYAESPNAECPYAECPYAECPYAECPYAECHYAECHYAECLGALATAERVIPGGLLFSCLGKRFDIYGS